MICVGDMYRMRCYVLLLLTSLVMLYMLSGSLTLCVMPIVVVVMRMLTLVLVVRLVLVNW